jgi:BirA family transcriptional regulator, biotin operon repressor / biotin---[acetyl-CoA-carboxylase] ligase
MVIAMCYNVKNARLHISSKLQILFYLRVIIMSQNELFSILDSVESTNNYAMEQAHAGLAKNGQAWFAKEQWGGKGQREKQWKSEAGQNIVLSMAIEPNQLFNGKPFLLSALVADICRACFAEIAGEDTKIKWPNDIYWRDRKAGGILIENIFKGKDWQWAIIGIGINVNQTLFSQDIGNATSLKLITNVEHDSILLAKKIQQMLLQEFDNIELKHLALYLKDLNEYLYKKNETVYLKKSNSVFATKIMGVNEYGQLLTEDVMERKFEVGEIEWVRAKYEKGE